MAAPTWAFVGSVLAVHDEQKGKKIIDVLVELLLQHRIEKKKKRNVLSPGHWRLMAALDLSFEFFSLSL